MFLFVYVRAEAKGALVRCKCVISGEEEGRSEGRLFSRTTLLHPASVGPSSPLLRMKMKRDLIEVMEEEAQELLSYFNHRNVDALLRLTRNTLEMLRKRIHASSLMHFLGECFFFFCTGLMKRPFLNYISLYQSCSSLTFSS